jgi:hypothetical protein
MDLARTDSAFLEGAFRAAGSTAPGDVIGYYRGDALVLVNPRAREIRFDVPGFTVDGAKDLLTGRAHTGAAMTLPAYGVAVLRAAR